MSNSASETTKGRKAWMVIRRLQSSILVYVALILVAVLLASLSPGSFTPTNLLVLLRQASPVGIVGIGQTFVIISGGIDLSVGSIILLTNVVTAGLIGSDESKTIPVILFCFAIALVVGLFNAVGVVRFKLPPLIMTMASMSIVSGIAYIWTRGAPTGMIPQSMRFLGMGFIGPIPIPVIFWAAFVVIAWVILQKTTIGRKVFAVGANPVTAAFSGVNALVVRSSCYVLSAVLACAAGLILSGYIGTTSMTLGDLYQFSSIIATVIGGTPFGGGVGRLSGTIAGAVMITLLNAVLTVVNVGPEIKQIINGAILITIVLVYTDRRKR